MFYERVPVPSGVPLSSVLADYGLLGQSRAILRHPNNAHLGTGIASTSRFVRATHIHLPINLKLTLVRAARTIDAQGLRPVRIGRTSGARSRPVCTHGVDVRVRRSMPVCKRIRWVQTVSRQEPPASARTFVDGGGNGLPFYNTWTANNPQSSPRVFDDSPCGQAATSGPSLIWTGVLSAAVWTGRRITLVKSLRYHFEIWPRDEIRFSPPRTASRAEINEQIRVLRLGRNAFGFDTGGRLDYRRTPSAGAINR